MPSYTLHLNPEPWAVGTVAYNRVSPNLTLKAFQEAVREELSDVSPLPEGEYQLQFYFWRQQAVYLDMADRKRQRNQADATNMQKALEDALQGVLFDNDRSVRKISSVIMDQGPDVEPGIIIVASMWVLYSLDRELGKIPFEAKEELARGSVKPASDNIWRGPQG